MHLQENTLFELCLGVKVTQNVAQYALHHKSYAPTKFEVAMPNSLGGDAFTRKCIIWPWPSGSVAYGLLPSCDTYTYNVLSCCVHRCISKKIHYLTFDLDRSRSHETSTLYLVLSTTCDLCICRVWSCYVQWFRRRYNYKKRDVRTDGRTNWRRAELATKLIYPIFLTKLHTFNGSELFSIQIL